MRECVAFDLATHRHLDYWLGVLGYLFEGVWGSYKTSSLSSPGPTRKEGVGYMDSPLLILWDSISLKLTNLPTIIVGKY